jgi:hypothetical protein
VLHRLEGASGGRRLASGEAQYLIRPDGYVAFHAAGATLAALRGYLERWFPGA